MNGSNNLSLVANLGINVPNSKTHHEIKSSTLGENEFLWWFSLSNLTYIRDITRLTRENNYPNHSPPFFTPSPLISFQRNTTPYTLHKGGLLCYSTNPSTIHYPTFMDSPHPQMYLPKPKKDSHEVVRHNPDTFLPIVNPLLV